MRPYEKIRQQNVVGKKNVVKNDDGNRINEHIAKLQAKFHGKTEEVKPIKQEQGKEEKKVVRSKKKEKKEVLNVKTKKSNI